MFLNASVTVAADNFIYLSKIGNIQFVHFLKNIRRLLFAIALDYLACKSVYLRTKKVLSV